MAEYFRDDEHRDVLLLIDNIFRFIQAGMEVSGLMGQMPSRLGYQPTMGTELSRLEERIANTDTGAITSIQAVYVPADDFTDPAAVHTFSHLSASIVLSRKRASEGLYPAIDPLQSSSKMATPGIVGERHYPLAQEIRRTLAQYAELKDIIAMLGLEQLSPEDRNVVGRARRLERFLTQPFFTTEQFTGLKGKLVSLEDALDGCERILRDEFKDCPGERAVHDRGDRRGEDEAEAREPETGNAGEPTMQPSALMNLKILLPFQVFAEKTGVLRIVAETRDGLVRAAAPPARLRGGAGAGHPDVRNRSAKARSTWRSTKACWSRPAPEVLVSVRRAIGGTDLGQLREAVEQEFLDLDEQEQERALGHGETGSGFHAPLRGVSS